MYMSSVRYLVATLCLIAVIGCSGNSGPTSPSLDGDRSGSNPETGTGTTEVADRTLHPGSLSSSPPGQTFVPNEILVVFHDQTPDTEINSIFESNYLQVIKQIDCRWGTVYRMGITDETPVIEVADRLKNETGIRFSEPNYLYPYAEVPYVPNDPMWESDDPGEDPRDNIFDQWGPSKIGASIVWNESNGSEDVLVAVIDTGIRGDHEDLASVLWTNDDEIPGNGIDDDENGYIDDTWGWDTADDDNDPWDDGDYGSYHGTACAGVLAAAQDNGVGLSGVAPGVRIMALKASFGEACEADIVECVEYAVNNGADIISMSFGGATVSEILGEAMDHAWENGNGPNLLACAQNYESFLPHFPAAYDSVMAVGATIPFAENGTPMDEMKITKYQAGYDWGSNFGGWLTVMGFGDKYMTTSGESASAYYDGVTDIFFGGTSCATPMSAGVMALIHSFHPGQTGQWYWDRLQDTADDLGEPGFDIYTGYGRCNALRAVYGSDRYSDLEDPLGFVPIGDLDNQAFDSIHDWPGNPYYDTEDLYKVIVPEDGYLVVDLDIFTWGENLDLYIFSDQDLSQLVRSSTGPNHADSSSEIIIMEVSAGEEYFIRVRSAGEGSSTTYGIRTFVTDNDLSVTGEDISLPFIHQGGEILPFIKLTLEISYQATLDEIIVTKSGTLQNPDWVKGRLYRDSNGNGEFDSEDQLISEELPPALNRVRFSDLNLVWTSEVPLVLFIAADISETLDECNVRFSLESYKDVVTIEDVEADYTDFPISSKFVEVGTDIEPPYWISTLGIETIQPGPNSVTVGFNPAEDELTPPVIYNVYYTDELPFNIGNALSEENVELEPGTATEYETLVIYMFGGKEWHFVVRAEDQAGNEDDNLDIMSCTPDPWGDPGNPVVLKYYPQFSGVDLAYVDEIMVIAKYQYGLGVIDKSDPLNMEWISSWNEENWIWDVVYDGTYAYTAGLDLRIFDLSDPATPILTDSDDIWCDRTAINGEYLYVINDATDAIWPFQISDPYDISITGKFLFDDIGDILGITLWNDYLYVSYSEQGIMAWDVSDPGYPSHVNSFGPDMYDAQIEVDDILYTVNGAFDITSYDLLSDPTNPDLISTCPDVEHYGPSDIVLINGFAYVGCYDGGLYVFDVTDPADMEQVGYLGTGEIAAMVNDGPIIYAIGEFMGITVIM